MPVASSAELLAVVKKSKLVPFDQLARFADTWSPDAPPADTAQALVKAGLITTFQSRLLLQGKSKGFVVAGKYKVLDLLGSGGMGSVYLCQHLTLQTAVALKILPSQVAGDGETKERFYREARAFATLNHPNLVRGFDLDADGDMHFIVMEYVDGVDLQALVSKAGPLSVARAVSYVRQAVVGLGHAHARGWVHRDIKPANICIDRGGTARVLDMGLARMVGGGKDGGITRAFNPGSVLGTADYLSPEQALGEDVDGRSDIYSLGCTLYYLLSARMPFGDGNTAQKLVWHQLKPPPPLAEVRSDIPAGLVRVVEQMMAKKPAERPQTADEVAVALAPWDTGGPHPPEATEFPRRLPAGLAVPLPLTPVASTPNPNSGTALTAPLSPGPASSGVLSQIRATGESAARVATKTKLPRWVPIVTILIVSIGGLAGGGYFFFAPPDLKPPEQQQSVAVTPFHGNVIVVSSMYGPGLGYPTAAGPIDVPRPICRTVAEALEKVRGKSPEDGYRIMLLDEQHAEQLDVNAAGLPAGLVIESATPNKVPTTWLPPPATDPAKPLVRLVGSSGLSVSGMSLDGMNRVDTLLVLDGPGEDTRVLDMLLTRYLQHAAVLNVAAGKPDAPVTLSRVRAFSNGPARPDAGLLLKSGGATSRYVVAEDCRFEGPGIAGVTIAGSAEYVTVRNARMFDLHAGVRVAAGPMENIRLTVERCTMARVKAAVRADGVPPGAADARIAVRNCLFIESGHWQSGPQVTPSSATKLLRGSDGNRWDKLTTVSEPYIVRPATVDLSNDPANDSAFLRYPPDNPLSKAGAGGEPVGAR
jgi:eukaryotic-like serine/threonine-protein kinase